MAAIELEPRAPPVQSGLVPSRHLAAPWNMGPRMQIEVRHFLTSNVISFQF